MDDLLLHESLKVLDEGAKLEIFASHWRQILSIVEKCKLSYQTAVQTGSPSQIEIWAVDDLEAVQHYFDQLLTLIFDEKTTDKTKDSLLLKYALDEDIFEHFFSYFDHASKFIDDLRVYQLTVYERLSMNDLVNHKRIVHPMLRLLSACARLPSLQIERSLVKLLHRIASNLDSNPQLLNLFWNPNHGSPKHNDKFLIFTVLVPFIHRDGEIGYKSREAILSLLRLSLSNYLLGQFISSDSDFCPVVATGLSGLYSSLPRKLTFMRGDWCRISSSRYSQITDLNLFINSLQFCNAVAVVAHPLIRAQLTSLLYNGFLVPVMGPALHQNSLDEIIAATAYLELCFRKLSDEDLLCTFLKFTLTEKYDEIVILESLINRIVHNQSKLAAVSLALFDTVIDLCAEDAMQQLIFKYLTPCSHVMRSQRSSLRDVDLYSRGAAKFLQLVPNCCDILTSRDSNSTDALFSYDSYLHDAQSMITVYSACSLSWSSHYDGLVNASNAGSPESQMFDETIDTFDDLGEDTDTKEREEFGEFLQMLRKAESPPPEDHDIDSILTELDGLFEQLHAPLELNKSTVSPLAVLSRANHNRFDYSSMPQYSLGISGLTDVCTESDSESSDSNSSPDIGPFLTSLLNKLENMLANSLVVNLLLTGLLAKLASYPQPLLRSFLASSTLVFQPSVKSLSQVLNSVRQKIDRYAETVPNFPRLLITGHENLRKVLDKPDNPVKEGKPPPDTDLGSPRTQGKRKRWNFFNKFFGTRPPQNADGHHKQLQQMPDGSYVYINRSRPDFGVFENPRTQNAVYCAIVFHEFLKELAAICQEHSVGRSYKVQ